MYEFCSQKELGALYNRCDVCLMRPGSTLFEVEAFHLHMFMIPLPESGNNHQYHNAKVFEQKGHTLLEEKDIHEQLAILLNTRRGYKKPNSPVKYTTEGFEVLVSLMSEYDS